jgi:hypothetical protein
MTSATSDRRRGLTGDKGIKAPVALATTGSITLLGEQVIDGTLTASSRVLVWQQADPVGNGLYDTADGAWTRCIDANGNNDLACGTLVKVTGGATQAGLIYSISTANPIYPGGAAINFVLDFTTVESEIAQFETMRNVERDRSGGFTDLQTLSAGTTTVTAAGTALDAYFNQAQTLYIPKGAYSITSDWAAPQRVFMDGKFTGVGRFKTTRSYSDHRNISALGGAYISGGNNVKVAGLWAPGGVTVDGGGSGLEWADVSHAITGKWEIELGAGFVNHNLWRSSHGGSVRYSDDGGASYGGAHANLHLMHDFSSANGLSNTSTHSNHTNWVIGGYVEPVQETPQIALTLSAVGGVGASITITAASRLFTPNSKYGTIAVGAASATITAYTSSTVVTATVVAVFAGVNLAAGSYTYDGNPNVWGNFHVGVAGMQGDTQAPPLVGKNNHILGMPDISERAQKDYLAFSGQNMLDGGEWEALLLDPRGSGLYFPGCYFGFGGATPAIVVDATEPSKLGKYLQYTMGVGDGLTIFVPQAPATADGSDTLSKDGLNLYWRGTPPTSVQVLRPDATSTFYGFNGKEVDANWSLLRMCLYGSTTGTTQIIMTWAAGGVFGIGGAFASNEKTMRLPAARTDLRQLVPTANGQCIQVQNRYFQSATVTVADTAAVATIIDVAITFNTAFSAAPTGIVGAVKYSLVSTDDAKMLNVVQHYLRDTVSTAGFTVRIIMNGAAVHWQGKISWDATGPK